MSTIDAIDAIDAIAAARKRYLESPRSRLDWVFYLEAVEALRKEHGPTVADPVAATGSGPLSPSAR